MATLRRDGFTTSTTQPPALAIENGVAEFAGPATVLPKTWGAWLEFVTLFRQRVPRPRTSIMSTLMEIEAAADSLPVEQKEQLLLFLATRLRAAGAMLPEPRQLSREEIAEWIAEDEADLRRFQGQP